MATPARQLPQGLLVSGTGIEEKQLRVKVLAGSRPAVTKSLLATYGKLNESETIYPRTDMQLECKFSEISACNSRFGVTRTSRRSRVLKVNTRFT